MALFSHQEDRAMGGISFEQKEFDALNAAAQRSGQTIGEWLADAIRTKLVRDEESGIVSPKVQAMREAADREFLWQHCRACVLGKN